MNLLAMLKLQLYNPFYCPDELKEENDKRIELILNSKGTYTAEKAFIEYALHEPETIKIETEDKVKVKIFNKCHELKCDFKIYFTNGVVRYSESNSILHFMPRSKETREEYADRMRRFYYKQEHMMEENKIVLNINFLTNYTEKNGFTSQGRKRAYWRAVEDYTKTLQFKTLYDKLKNPRLSRNLNMTVSFNDVFILVKCGIRKVDYYMQSLLDRADCKHIEKIYEEQTTVKNSYRFG